MTTHVFTLTTVVVEIAERRARIGWRGLCLVLGLLVLGGCEAGQPSAPGSVTLPAVNPGMAELNGNEKHAELPKALPESAGRPGTIRQGDLMLYGATTLVVFYVSFDSSYSYTRIGRVDDPEGLAQALGRRTVQINFAKQ